LPLVLLRSAPGPIPTIASGNTAIGDLALTNNDLGGSNTAIHNTAVGASALLENTDSFNNTAVGAEALLSNDLSDAATANNNTAVGWRALTVNVNSGSNTAVGSLTLRNNDSSANGTATDNTAVGASALQANIDGTRHTAVGFQTLQNCIAPPDFAGNTAIGARALANDTTGNFNTAIGDAALISNTTGGSNTALGAAAGIGVNTASNVICIGAVGANTDNSCFIANIFGATSSGGAAVFINSSGQLGTTTSSSRFKDEIKPMEQASEALLALKPVTFRYKKEIDPARTSQFGLVGEEVEKVNPQLVVRDKEGKPYSVRYDQVNAMLLNEFLKEHRKVEDLEANTVRQQKQIEALTAGLQKVSAQLEASKPGPQVVNNNQ
jgi:hypothetical protein